MTNQDNAKDELTFINSIIKKTLYFFKDLSPLFLSFSILMLIYNILDGALELSSLWSAINSQKLVSYGDIHNIISIIYNLGLIIIFLFFSYRIKKNEIGVMSRTLLSAWGICVFIFSALSIFLQIVLPLISPLLSEYSEQSGTGTNGMLLILSIIFPAMPIIFTGILVQKRVIKIIGYIIIIFAVLRVISSQVIVLSIDSFNESNFVIICLTIILTQLISPISLFILSLNAKKC